MTRRVSAATRVTMNVLSELGRYLDVCPLSVTDMMRESAHGIMSYFSFARIAIQVAFIKENEGI